MDEELDFLFDIPFNFFESLSLQKLASTKLALRLWHDKIIKETEKQLRRMPCDPNRSSSSQWSWFWSSSCLDGSKKFSCREIIVVPTRIRDLIDEQIVPIGNELRFWRDKLLELYPEIFRLGVPNEKVVEILLSFLDNVVFKRDYTICMRSTVMRVLIAMEEEITPTARYKIACEFCLESCVQECWPLVRDVVGRSRLEQSPLIMYWNDIMMNIRNPAFIDNELISSMSGRNWAASEYFWNQWSRSEQTSRAIDVLGNADFHVMKFLLPKLNIVQAKTVCRRVGDCIFGKIIEKDEHFEYAMKCWIYMKDFIPGRVFCGIIGQLWSIVFNNPHSNIEKIHRRDALLHEIWITASDQLKLAVLDRDFFDTLFKLLDDKVRGVDSYNIDFVLELLANVDHDVRRSVWLENWRKFVVRAGPSKLEELMKLCLVNDEEIEQFKADEMANFEKLESYFSLCIEKKLISELCQYLNFCVKNPRRLENLSKEIILSNLHTILFCRDDNELAKFHSLIHGTFRDLQSANKFTKELILAPECLGFIYCKLDEGCFDEVINTANRFPTDEKNLNEMKREFLDYCNRNLARGQITKFDGQKLENFLYWCSFDETTISEFKQSLIIDDIFDIIVNKAIQEGCTSVLTPQSLLDFNNFLEWYFGCWENAKIYKSSKMFHYKESGILKNAFNKDNLVFVRRFLHWAFDHDANKIEIVEQLLINEI